MAVDLNLEPIESFHYYVQFRKDRANPAILSFIQYDKKEWDKNTKHPLDVAQELIDFCHKYSWIHKTSTMGTNYNSVLLAGHNLKTFDIPVLFTWYKALNRVYRKNFWFPASHHGNLDTLQMAEIWALRTRKFPVSYRLSELCKWYGIEIEGNPHESQADVQMTYALLKHFRELLKWDFIST